MRTVKIGTRQQNSANTLLKISDDVDISVNHVEYWVTLNKMDALMYIPKDSNIGEKILKFSEVFVNEKVEDTLSTNEFYNMLLRYLYFEGSFRNFKSIINNVAGQAYKKGYHEKCDEVRRGLNLLNEKNVRKIPQLLND